MASFVCLYVEICALCMDVIRMQITLSALHEITWAEMRQYIRSCKVTVKSKCQAMWGTALRGGRTEHYMIIHKCIMGMTEEAYATYLKANSHCIWWNSHDSLDGGRLSTFLIYPIVLETKKWQICPLPLTPIGRNVNPCLIPATPSIGSNGATSQV